MKKETLIGRVKKAEDEIVKLDDAIRSHLLESGKIQATLSKVQTDAEWIKRGVWTGAAAFLTFVGTLIVAIVTFLLHR